MNRQNALRLFSVFSLIVIIAFALACGGGGGGGGDGQEQGGELEGTWEMFGVDGYPEEWTFVFSGDLYSATGPSESFSGTFTSNTNASPKEIDLLCSEISESSLEGQTAIGIYQITGNTLTLAINKPGLATRPSSFAAGGNIKLWSSTRGSGLNVPQASIEVDGDKNDWAGVDGSAVDPEGDQWNDGNAAGYNEGSDIEAVWCAVDSTSFYIMIETADSTISSDLDYRITFDTDNDGFRDSDGDFTVACDSGAASLRAYDYPDHNALTAISEGASYAVGEVLEISLLLSSINVPSEITIRAYTRVSGLDNSDKDMLDVWLILP